MFEDKVLKHKRAEGYYRRNAELGNVDGAWKNFVEANKAPDPSSMKLAKYIPRHEMDNMNTKDLEQTPDSVLKPGETLEDFDVTFRRPNADGGVQQLVQNTVDGSRPGYKGENKISFQDQHRTSGGTYKKMYSMEDIRKLGKELNVSEYNKKTGIKLTSEEYRAVVNNSKSRFNFYKNQFDSFSPKKKKSIYGRF